MADSKLATTLKTTRSLLDQFTLSLSSLSPEAAAPAPPVNSPSPLPLLSACAATLKAQTTKLSLLIITPPFTPSAVSTILASFNDSILPSILTATLLVSGTSFTNAFSAEAISLAKSTLRDLRSLVYLADARSKDKSPTGEPPPSTKSAVTEATGKIWQDCDHLKSLAENGIGGFVVRKAEEYLELIKDAVKELEDWDPEADDDEDDEVWSDGTEDAPVSADTPHTAGQRNDTQIYGDMSEAKSLILKILVRIPQSLHVVLHQRLKKGLPSSPTTSQVRILDNVLTNFSHTSTCVDDLAERLYTHDALGALLTIEKARGLCIDMVSSVLAGWKTNTEQDGTDGAEDNNGIATTSSPVKAKEEKGASGGSESQGTASLDAAAKKQEEEDEDKKENFRPQPPLPVQTKEDRYIARALEWIKSVGLPELPPETLAMGSNALGT